jgi:hypothetical protein
MQTPPLNYEPLLTVIKYGLLFGLITHADIEDWVAAIAPSNPFLVQLSQAGNTDQVANLINGRRIAGADTLTARALLGLLYQKLNNGLISVPQAAKAVKAVDALHLLAPAEENYINDLTYDSQGDLPDRFVIDLDVHLLDFLAFYEAYSPDNFEQWIDLNQQVNQYLEAAAERQGFVQKEAEARQRKANKEARLSIAAIIAAGVIALFVVYELIDHVASKSDQYGNSIWILFPVICLTIGKLVYAEVSRRRPS